MASTPALPRIRRSVHAVEADIPERGLQSAGAIIRPHPILLRLGGMRACSRAPGVPIRRWRTPRQPGSSGDGRGGPYVTRKVVVPTPVLPVAGSKTETVTT